ncbi:hypothetical protein QP568_00165 [Propionimicrobium lymphophilum]|nr:hypothetical protein [Propionimicrobium lymphophilum]MDK7710029.1 hypothetical protein [Propionimicrobium lymphophilum]MDK7732722.1 hypothetical protein [Propionimicrobium lymphophilum]
MTVAIIFAFIGTMVFFGFLRRVRLRSSLIVPIIGIMLGAVISAATYSDRICAMKGGKIVKFGPLAEVMKPDVLSGIFDTDIDIIQGPAGRWLSTRSSERFARCT